MAPKAPEGDRRCRFCDVGGSVTGPTRRVPATLPDKSGRDKSERPRERSTSAPLHSVIITYSQTISLKSGRLWSEAGV